MPSKRKKFIDKKNAVTFRLVHRSQKDPLVADERASKHVLLDSSRPESDAAKKRKEEQSKYGIYFDDEYNYLQHLKDVNRVAYWEPVSGNARSSIADEFTKEPLLQLPSSVFQSTVEESEGLLNKAAPKKGPRPDWDPDIVAALDDCFDFDDPSNELEDNFFELANAERSDDGEASTEGASDIDDLSDSDRSFGEEETKSHFTNYSMSSSVINRNEGLQTLDEQFEKLYELYEEDEIGALDGEDIGGRLNADSSVMQSLLKEYEEHKEDGRLKDVIQRCVGADPIQDGESSDEEIVGIAVHEENKEDRWDCESVLSNYSNLYNRPKLIIEPKQKAKIEVSGRTGLPKDVLRPKGLTERQLKGLDSSSEGEEDCEIRTTASTVRPPNETPEQRRVRKAEVRELRRERRMEKKANKQAFKLEEKRQAHVIKNLKQNLQSIKLL